MSEDIKIDNDKMTVNDAWKLKAQLESNVIDMFTEFEQKTGCQIDKVDIDRTSMIIEVKIKAML